MQNDPGVAEAGGEREVLQFRPVMRGYGGRFLLGLLLSPVVIGLFILAGLWVRKYSNRYRLTTERFFLQRGLLSRQTDEIELFRVKDVSFSQTLLQRLFGCGTIRLLSTDDTTPEVVIEAVARPEQLKDEIREHYRAARSREHVRAAEFIPS